MLELKEGGEMGCEHCNILMCPVLNKAECPINQLWERAGEAKELIAEAERIIQEGSEKV